MEHKVRNIIAEIDDLSFDAYSIDSDVDLNEKGLESLQIVQIIVGIEETFGVEISMDISLEDKFTIKRIVEEIANSGCE